jgi:CRISPR-associated protein Csy1
MKEVNMNTTTSLDWLNLYFRRKNMVDPAIQEFLSERIHRRIESKTKEYVNKNGQLTEEKAQEIENLAFEEYKLENWLLTCAKNAHGISLTTHPCKFSHPDANSSTVYFKSDKKNIGFLHTSNEESEDVLFSTAAYMPIYSFLKLKLSDGMELLEHLDNNTEIIKSQFCQLDDYESVRVSLLKVKENDSEVYTDEKIKQVFFPASNGYHLLSILSSSVLVFSLKQKLKELNSFERNQKARKAKTDNEYFQDGYKEIKNLTLQGHVKSNPQCISQLNKDNFGETYLLASTPPTIESRLIRFPKTSFFGESIQTFHCRDVFAALHSILKTEYNNINIREGRDYRLQELMDRIIDRMWAVRSVADAQYHERTSNLKLHQKIWLCEENSKIREESDSWLENLIKEISKWISHSYEKSMGKRAVKLSDTDLSYIFDIVSQNKEALR